MALSCIISEIKRDIGRKSSFFSYPLHSTLPYGGPRRNIAISFGVEKTRMMALPDGEKKSDDMITRHAIHERDGRTYRHTDRHTDTACRHRPRLCIASRGKNELDLRAI